jgi:hypothetical protein
MSTYHATECVFEVDGRWLDDTGYTYQAGPVGVVIGPFAPLETWRAKVDEALEKFKLSVPAYELVERRELDRPAPGAELVSMRVGGQLELFELSIFWPIGGKVWVFRSRGPLSAEEACREAAATFLETYQPVEEES